MRKLSGFGEYALLTCFMLFATLGTTSVTFAQGWQNSSLPADISGDGIVSPLDILINLNELLVHDVSGLDGSLPAVASPPPYYDASGDGYLTPLDVLISINEQPELLPLAATPGPARLGLFVTDADGNPTDQVSVGETFAINLTFSDQRNPPNSVFGAYIDLIFDNGLVTTDCAVSFDSVFEANGSKPVVTGNRVESLSSYLLEFANPELQSVNMLSVPFVATSTGTAQFEIDNAYALLFGINNGISPSLDGVSLSIVPEPGTGPLMLVSLLSLVGLCRQNHIA